MRGLLFVIRASAALLVLGVFLLLLRWSGPDIEAAIAPVITRQSADHVDTLAGGALTCWTWRLDKVRPARGVDANWTIRAGDRAYPFQRVLRVADSVASGDLLVDRPVRPGQWSRKCIDVPPELIGLPFTITGFVEYRTALTGWLWPIRQETAEVTVP